MPIRSTTQPAEPNECRIRIAAAGDVHYGRDVVKPFIKTFPAGAFGICLFDLVAWLWLERIGLTLTVVLGYAVAVAYLTVVGWLRYAGSLSPSGGAGTSNALTMPERSAK